MLDVKVIEFGLEEKVIRPVGPLCTVNVLFGKLPDGGILAATMDKPEDFKFVPSDKGEWGTWYRKDFACRTYYLFYCLERYTDLELRLVVGPHSFARAIRSLADMAGALPPDEEKGLDFAVRLENINDAWQFNVWTLGQKPLTKQERKVLNNQYVQLTDVATESSENDVEFLLENCKAYDPIWTPTSNPQNYILDFFAGDLKTQS